MPTISRCGLTLLILLISTVSLSGLLSGQEVEKPVVNPPSTLASDADITEADPKTAAAREQIFLSSARQLTFEGRRAGEGYFSADGTQLVFQSEREAGNPFFQIYVMDLETGDVERVSPGQGKTTCAWIHPDGDRVLFGSTHHDPKAVEKQREELEFRASGKERRYSWDYDPHFELFEYDRESKKYNRLTDAEGYDAEASWSPDGKLIAFTSNRLAYQEQLSGEDKKLFEQDPAYMNDIYIMDSDGGNVRRLTEARGYDGGPFFSPDGERICWRRFTPNGAIAEIWTMKLDGSDKRQLTRLGVMSWAPYYHPSGEYLIFTTNRHGFANFELYLIDAEGKSAPVRVSHTKGFDGLPVFSPDGRQLVWTSNRTSSKQSQLFTASWNHDAARQALGLDSDADDIAASSEARSARQRASAQFAPEDIMRHVDYLCRDELEGRLTGTRGEKLATAYVAAYLDSLGLKPAGDDGGWYQSFPFPAGIKLGSHNRLASGDVEWDVDKDWRPLSFSANGPVEAGEVVFAGYGIVAQKDGEQAEYDSYVHLDVKDKWVVVLRFQPEDVPAERRQQLSRASELRYKTMVARDRGAKGLIIVTGPRAKVRNQLAPLRSDGALAGASIPVISVRDEVVASWLRQARSKHTLSSLQETLDSGEMMMGFPLEGVKVSASIEVRHLEKTGRNVIGRLQLGDQPTAEAIIVGAHIDHLGRGNSSSSLAKPDEQGLIHYGADDNASGVAAMLEVAEYLADQKAQGKLNAKRDILFAAWSGEELGLIGSNFFVKNYPLPTAHGAHGHGHSHGAAVHAAAAHGGKGDGSKAHNAKTNPPAKHPHGEAKKPAPHGEVKKPHAKPEPPAAAASGPAAANPHAMVTPAQRKIYPAIAACINMDMVGRLKEKLVLQGVGSSPIWTSEIERRNAPVGLPITLQMDSYLPTDASSFYMHGVPILSAFTGSHEQYHSPRDTPDRLNFEGTAKIARLMGLITRSLSMRQDSPEYVVQAAPEEGQRKARLRAYLGTVPDYVENIKGVKLSGASKGGPADKAGVKAGDIIVELAGRKIENIYDYTYAIEALKIGQKVKVVVLRGGKRVTLEVVPGSRD